MHELSLKAKQSLSKTDLHVNHEIIAEAFEEGVLGNLDAHQRIPRNLLGQLISHPLMDDAVAMHDTPLNHHLDIVCGADALLIAWDLILLNAIVPLVHPNLPLLHLTRTSRALFTSSQVRLQTTRPADDASMDSDHLLTATIGLFEAYGTAHLRVVNALDFRVTIFLVLLDQLLSTCVVQEHLHRVTEDFISISDPVEARC
mmetsp:Transcript_28365/g.51210  ORF Transcript_28365/g.51210 Transcript_28365/m.51210 type:complete len:201 (-) Transcript_28365:728-1330(-)